MHPTTLTEALRRGIAHAGVAAVREGRQDAAASLHDALSALEGVPGRPLADWAQEWLQAVLEASNLDPDLVDLADYVEALKATERRPAILSAALLIHELGKLIETKEHFEDVVAMLRAETGLW